MKFICGQGDLFFAGMFSPQRSYFGILLEKLIAFSIYSLHNLKFVIKSLDSSDENIIFIGLP